MALESPPNPSPPSVENDSSSPLHQIKQYHERTKHDFNRYARSLGYMDWANQPNPFRRYDGAPLFRLPLLASDEDPLSPSYEELFRPHPINSIPISLISLSRFFEYALSITAWKEAGGNRWALRSNPSSGNLHPTEGYLFVGSVPDLSLEPGLYHYAPKEHGLEQRMICSSHLAHQLLQPFPPQTFLVGLSSIHWREAWKYGERAFRYCQHDLGHAIGTLRIAAATLGWQMVILTGLADQTIGKFLGLHRLEDFDQAEPEFPELLAIIWPRISSSLPTLPLYVQDEIVEDLTHQNWQGKANRLSRDNPIPWESIDEVTKASWKSPIEPTTISCPPPSTATALPYDPTEEGSESSSTAYQIIHQRRSALSFDGKTGLPAPRFLTMLQRVMPHDDLPLCQRPLPWDVLPWDPTIHLALFVHRIEGLLPGLYLLIRSPQPEKQQAFQQAMHEQFVWTTPDGCPQDLPLFLLEDGNAQKIAMQVSCWQEIAGESAFALGMIAEFDRTLEEIGPWFYKRLYWETGVIGQVLYLEAEAAGVRATGIGCFFDDPVHRVLGFPDSRFQSLYHFTTGGPVEDTRLTTLPPYGDHMP